MTTQAQILTLIERLQDEFGSAVILITHDLGVVAEIADDVVVMYAARVVEQAPVETSSSGPSTRTPGACSARCRGSTRTSSGCVQIPGQPPSLLRPPKGCRFHPRCAYTMSICRETEPLLVRLPTTPAHLQACHLDDATKEREAARIVGAMTGRRLMALQSRRSSRRARAQGRRAARRHGPREALPGDAGIIFRKQIGAVKAVDGVSLAVREGETLGIVGESGCGKSTLARCILQAARADRRKPRLPRPGHHPPLARRDASVPARDDDDLPGSVRVAEPAEARRLHRRPRRSRCTSSGTEAEIKHRVQELLEVVGLNPEHYNRFPHEFSGGQRQRIGVARALAVNPKLIICDEPVSALDVSVQAQILNLLKDLQRDFGLTYIFIAHDLNVVRHISDRVMVMYLGQVVEQASRADAVRRAEAPLHRRAAVGRPRARPDAARATASGSCSRATCRARSTRRRPAASIRAARASSQARATSRRRHWCRTAARPTSRGATSRSRSWPLSEAEMRRGGSGAPLAAS